MTLAELLAAVPHELVCGRTDIDIAAVRADSRQVGPVDVFVCLPGYQSEGGERRADRHDFAAEAVARGAAALVVERPVDAGGEVTVVRVENGWQAIAAMACAYYRQPSRELTVVGVTGTSGKTSTSYFLESVLAAAGLAPACLGTIEYRIAGEVLPAQQTTPEAPELQRLLRLGRERGCRSVVMEVSSHALELRRVGGIAFDVGV
ncbi:MAG TPA: Mur ligase family protein, partial [Terriglobales bacterium]|nr:Mur ligase family protein [Terriglobales bacterium]